jgi:hypothetical protein
LTLFCALFSLSNNGRRERIQWGEVAGTEMEDKDLWIRTQQEQQ